VRSSDAPPGTLTIEVAPSAQEAAPIAAGPSSAAAGPLATSLDWPSYNRALTSERYSPLGQINRDNVGRLKVLCTYDTKEHSGFETGPIMVNGALIGTTEHDIFSIDPATCHENWRTHEDYVPAQILKVNRGAAYLDGLLYRGTEDGRVLAYDFKTGKRVWKTTIADAKLAESTPAAPIAWNGLVFIGNAGGDNKGVKGRMYALDAKTGKIVWEFYLVPKGPGDPTRGPQGTTPLDASTWGNQAGTPITGGATWTSYTLDPATGELDVPGGNPAPDFALGPREGADLYAARWSCSTRRQGPTNVTSNWCLRTGTTGMSPTRPPSSRRGVVNGCWRSRRRTGTCMALISPPMRCSTVCRSLASRTPTRAFRPIRRSTSVRVLLVAPNGTALPTTRKPT
jgi:glucose dehydrogenase